MSSIYYKNQKYTGPTLDLGSGSLTTDDKTIVGAINELDAEVGAIPEIKATDVKNDLTPATGVTIQIARCATAGKMVCYNIIFTTNQALTAGTSVLSGLSNPAGGLGGVPAFYATNTAATGATFYKMVTTYPGELLVLDAVTSGANLRMAFCYIKE